MRRRFSGSAAAALFAVLPCLASPAQGQSAVEGLLRHVADASGDDLSRLASGAAFVRTVETDDRRELTLVYAVRVRAPLEVVLEEALSGHLLIDDAEGPAARGVFGGPPSLDDLSDLSLERRELRDLERCRLFDCELKLSADAIDRLGGAVNWSSHSASEAANRFFRREMLSVLEDYQRHGDRGAPVYADKPEPLRVAAGLERLATEAEYLADLDAGLHRHLHAWPGGRAEGIEDAFSWTVEDLGVKSVVSLNHIAIRRQGPSDAAIIGVKRFYANHYFQAGLRIVAFSPVGGDRRSGDTYVTVVARSRFDGEIGGIRRTAMERRLEVNAEAVLERVRERLEAVARAR